MRCAPQTGHGTYGPAAIELTAMGCTPDGRALNSKDSNRCTPVTQADDVKGGKAPASLDLDRVDWDKLSA